ncbi:hypothetical protein GC194_07260 [bacterium]|nr:hypothetical protein [bacterium]
MQNQKTTKSPDNTAIRTALWRALHAQLDAPPRVIHNEIGLLFIQPASGWQERADIAPRKWRIFSCGKGVKKVI